MVLSDSQFKGIIESPLNKEELKNAAYDNDRMAFHAKRATSFQDISNYYTYFKQEVDKILIPSKQKAFWDLFQYPVATTQILSDASDELNKVFNAKDKAIELQCSDETLTADFKEYEDNHICEFFEYKVFNAIFQNCNAWVIIDLPTAQAGKYPEPYPILVTANQVYDILVEREKVQYICLKKSEELYLFIDDLNYYQVQYKNGVAIVIGFSFHGLGYCPVFPIWSDGLNDKGIRKISPLIDILSRLDDYVFNFVQKKFLDLYADSPILEKFESRCDSSDCVNGYLTDSEGKQKACPTCSNNRKFIGAGSVVTKPMPNGMNGEITNAASWIAVPVESLNYTKEKLIEAKSEIFEYLTGYVKGGDRTQAVNQDQVYSQLEARKSKLNWLAENLEKAYSATVKATGQLRYDSDFVGVHISLGSDFHLWTLQDALNEYDLSKKTGLPMFILSSIRDNITDLVAGSSNYKEQRLAILKLLEPMPDVDISLLSRDTAEYELKLGFSGYISRFELENNTNVVSFGSLIPMSVKIQKIKDILYLYANETLERQFQSKSKYQIKPVIA